MPIHCQNCQYTSADEVAPAAADEPWVCPQCGAKKYFKVLSGTVHATGSAEMRAAPSLWAAWMRVAIERTRCAEQCRDDAAARPAADQARFFTAEFDASITAITAAVLALDALYASFAVPLTVRQAVWLKLKSASPSRHAVVRENLSTVFAVDNATAKAWKTEFTKLFGLRDQVVHHEQKLRLLTTHRRGHQTAFEQAEYYAEAAVEATEFSLEVLRFCVDHPKAVSRDWAQQQQPVVAGLEARWAGRATWSPADAL